MGALKVWEVGVTTSAVTASPTSISSSEAFGTPSATQTGPNITATPNSIASSEAYGTTVATLGNLQVSPASIASGEAVGSPAAQTSYVVSPTSIGSQEAVNGPVVAQGLTVVPASIVSSETVNPPTCSTTLTASPSSIGTGESLGVPLANFAYVAVPGPIASAESFGALVVHLNLTIIPSSIPSGVAFGEPLAFMGVYQSITQPDIVVQPNQADLKVGESNMPYAIRAGDLLPDLVITLTDKGRPLDLSDFDSVLVKIRFEDSDDVLEKNAQILDQTLHKGQVRVVWSNGDTDRLGDHDVIAIATGIDGDRTFPGEGEGSVTFASEFA